MNIDKLILKLLNKSNSLEEFETLEAWKQESESNIALLELLNMKSDETEYTKYNVKNAWNKVSARLGFINFSKSLKWILASAAFIAIIISLYYFNGQSKSLPVFQSDEKVNHFVLQDNSEVWLNNNSLLAHLEDFEISRMVSLEGEAFFEIEHNTANPFIIELNNNEFIKVIGTSFKLVNDASNFDLILYTGKLELHALNRIINLEQGDRITRVNGSYVKLKDRDFNASSWKTDELLFDNTSFPDVIKDLENHFHINIQINDEINYANCSLYAKYKNQSLDSILEELVKIWNMKFSNTSEGIMIDYLSCQ